MPLFYLLKGNAVLGLNLVEDMVIYLQGFNTQHQTSLFLSVSVYHLYTVVKTPGHRKAIAISIGLLPLPVLAIAPKLLVRRSSFGVFFFVIIVGRGGLPRIIVICEAAQKVRRCSASHLLV